MLTSDELQDIRLRREQALDTFSHENEWDYCHGKLTTLLEDDIPALLDTIAELRQACERAEVLMDTLMLSGIGEAIPPGYRDGWADVHIQLRKVLGIE